MIEDYFENEFARFWICNQILFFEYKDKVVIDLAAAQCIVVDRVRVQKEVAYPVFCDARGIISIDKEARDYLAQSGSILTKAVSLLVYQSVSFSMSSFYLKISKPRVPTRMFTDKTAALAFLSNYILCC
jgi:hypothetical protein